MYNSIFGYRYINGYKIDFFGWDKEKEQILYEIYGKIRKAKRHYVCKWGGNPYPGTIIEYYQIILPTGKKVKYNIYA